MQNKAAKKLIYITTARLPTEKAHGYQICRMCEAFARQGIEVTLLHPYRLQPDAGLRQKTVFAYYGITPVFTVQPLSNSDIFKLERFVPKSLFRLIFFLHSLLWGWYAVRYVRKTKADIYYTRDIPTAFWLVRHGLPTIYESHTIPRGFQQRLLQAVAAGSSLLLVVCLTSFLKKQLFDMGFPAKKLTVLSDAVEEALFQDLEDMRTCRGRLGLPLARPIIGYIGRFTTMEKEKGIEQLIEALGQIHSGDGAEPLLLCVGGPMDRVAHYRECARRHGIAQDRALFVDRVPNSDVPSWIKACDVVTVPWPWNEFSAYYTSPMKLFEYMAAGVPIVASDLPSLRDILRHGENARLVQPGDPSALATGITQVLSHPDDARRMSRQAQLDVKKCTWVKRAESILNALPPGDAVT